MSDIPSECSPFEVRLIHILRIALVVLSLALSFLIVATVLMRYVFESPFLAIEEASTLIGSFLYFIGAAFVTATRTHITGGAMHVFIQSPNARRIIVAFTTALCLFVTIISLYYAWKYTAFTFDRGRTSNYLRWPRGLWACSMVVGFALMILFQVLQLVRDVRSARTHDKGSA